MPTFPNPADPVSALTRADGTTEAHSIDHGRVIGIWENAKHHGAKGDDAFDNTTAFADAQAALGVAGGTVFCPPGTYRGNIVLNPRVHIRGAGIGVTILKAPNSSNADVVKGLNFATLTGKAYAAGDYARGAYECGLHDLTIDGNKANNAAGYGVRIWGRRPTFENVEVINGSDGGIWTEFTEVDNFLDPAQVLEGYFANISSHSNDGDGWVHRGPHDSVAVKYTAWGNTGWALKNEVVGSATGGMALYLPNSFMNDTGSFYCSAGIETYGGAASAANVGIGFQLEGGAGSSSIIGTRIGGHTTGILLKAQNCVIDVNFQNNPGDCIEYGGSPAFNTIRFNGAGNTNGIKFAVNEAGSQHVVGKLTGGTLYTGTGTRSTRSSYDVTKDSTALFQLSSDALLSSNGWTPTLPASNAELVVPGLAATGKLLCSAGIGVGNSAAATEVIGKAVVKKMEVFDSSGTSLGYVPIYSSIT